MESLKKYLPLIIIAVVGFILLRMFKSNGPTILPQTQFNEVPYTDPNAALRLPAFQSLAELAGIQTQADVRAKEIESEKDIARMGFDVERSRDFQSFAVSERSIINQLESQLRQFDLLETLGLKSEETELAKTGLQTELAKYLQETQLDFRRLQEQNYLEQLRLYFMQREQDRQFQQSAIDRLYSSRNTSNIVGSIAQAVSGIFGGQGSNIFGTPPTFPSSGLGGFFGGLF